MITSTLNWWLSKHVRHARQMCSHASKLVAAQKDLLKPQGLEELNASIHKLQKSTEGKIETKVIEENMNDLEKVAQKWILRYPWPSYRENVEVLLVAIAVAMGIRTFFLQPFKIPTGSMQPTLYGITAENKINDPSFTQPNVLVRWFEFLKEGKSYYHIKAESDGEFSIIDHNPKRFLLFNLKQTFRIGNTVHTVWFPPDNLFRHAGFTDGQAELHASFRKGDDVIKMVATTGDHLFVDRVSYNFRRPERGDIVVFKTEGIRYGGMPQDQFYIKRLIGMGGETVQIGDDSHVIIDGKRLDKSTRHFEKLYDESAWDYSQYMGHVNNNHPRLRGMVQQMLFVDGTTKYPVPPKNYLVMGDNTFNSSDSRYWGSFPRENVIGKSFFVYWPFNKRWGWWGHD